MNKFHKVFCDNVERIRKEKGLSQKELADRTGIGQTRLSRIENGKVEPGLITLDTLAKGLEVSATELLIDTDEKDKSLLNLLIQLQSVSETDQKLISLLLESFLEKTRLEKLQNKKLNSRLEELEKIREESR